MRYMGKYQVFMAYTTLPPVFFILKKINSQEGKHTIDEESKPLK